MAVTAEQVRHSIGMNGIMQGLVKDHLLRIDAIIEAHDRVLGINCVPYDLPVVLEIPGMSTEDWQLILFSSLMKSLLDRGFTVKIRLAKESNVLYIAWVAEITEEELRAMRSIIRVNRVDDDSFLEDLRTSTSS